MSQRKVETGSSQSLVLLKEDERFFVRLLAPVNGRDTYLTRKIAIDQADLERLATTDNASWEKEGLLIYTRGRHYHVYRDKQPDLKGDVGLLRIQ